MGKQSNQKAIYPKAPAPLVSPKGSLALLAYGDIGIRTWRQLKKEAANQDSKNEK